MNKEQVKAILAQEDDEPDEPPYSEGEIAKLTDQLSELIAWVQSHKE